MKIDMHNIKRRWRIYAPTAVLLVLVAAYSLYWSSLAATLRQNIDAWITAQNQQGMAISYGSLDIGGYPYRLDITLTDVTVSQPGHPNHWTWSAPEIVGITLPYELNHMILELHGAQRLEYMENLGPEARAPSRYVVTARADSARSSLIFSGRKMERLSIDLNKLSATRQGPYGVEDLTAARLQIHTRPLVSQAGLSSAAPLTGLDLYIQADDLTLPFDKDFQSHPLTPIERLEINILMTDMNSAALNADALSSWAQKGGQMEIAASHLLWEKMNVSATGSLHLDDMDRPEGKLRVLIGGYDQMVTLMVRNGALDRNTGALLSSSLGIVAAFSGDKEGRIQAPVRISEGDIYLGPAKIGSVGPLLSPYN